MKKIIFVNSHPIQYFTPLYKYLNDNGLETEAWYWSDESLKESKDKEFGINVKWDIPLLDGYKATFFKNNSWKPSHFNGFWGLMNFGMIPRLWKMPKAVFIVHGWAYCTNVLLIIAARIRGHKVCLRCEMPQNQELMKKGIKQKIKRIGLRYGLFPFVNQFLYIGSQNKAFYESYGVKNERLVFAPYSVDNKRFQTAALSLQSRKKIFREQLGIGNEDKVILFSGKYIEKKRPMDLLKAFGKLNRKDVWLVMIGEGELRKEMESYIAGNNIQNVLLTGFVNQSEIPDYYNIGDVFVMCSSIGETWGLSVNEAMNFGLPVVISDTPGSSYDLVSNGKNGYVFTTGNEHELADKIARVIRDIESDAPAVASASLSIVQKYSYQTILESFKESL